MELCRRCCIRPFRALIPRTWPRPGRLRRWRVSLNPLLETMTESSETRSLARHVRSDGARHARRATGGRNRAGRRRARRRSRPAGSREVSARGFRRCHRGILKGVCRASPSRRRPLRMTVGRWSLEAGEMRCRRVEATSATIWVLWTCGGWYAAGPVNEAVGGALRRIPLERAFWSKTKQSIQSPSDGRGSRGRGVVVGSDHARCEEHSASRRSSSDGVAGREAVGVLRPGMEAIPWIGRRGCRQQGKPAGVVGGSRGPSMASMARGGNSREALQEGPRL